MFKRMFARIVRAFANDPYDEGQFDQRLEELEAQGGYQQTKAGVSIDVQTSYPRQFFIKFMKGKYAYDRNKR